MDFCLFANNIGKTLSNKNGQKLLGRAKKSTTDAIKTASKRLIQKTAETTGDLIGKKMAEKITSVSTKKSAELCSTKNDDANNEIEVPKKDISPKERQQTIEELRLV